MINKNSFSIVKTVVSRLQINYKGEKFPILIFIKDPDSYSRFMPKYKTLMATVLQQKLYRLLSKNGMIPMVMGSSMGFTEITYGERGAYPAIYNSLITSTNISFSDTIEGGVVFTEQDTYAVTARNISVKAPKSNVITFELPQTNILVVDFEQLLKEESTMCISGLDYICSDRDSDDQDYDCDDQDYDSEYDADGTFDESTLKVEQGCEPIRDLTPKSITTNIPPCEKLREEKFKNTDFISDRFKQAVAEALSEIKDVDSSVSVVCDETNNSEQDRTNNVLNVLVSTPKPVSILDFTVDSPLITVRTPKELFAKVQSYKPNQYGNFYIKYLQLPVKVVNMQGNLVVYVENAVKNVEAVRLLTGYFPTIMSVTKVRDNENV